MESEIGLEAGDWNETSISYYQKKGSKGENISDDILALERVVRVLQVLGKSWRCGG